jgi:hypothetical protein
MRRARAAIGEQSKAMLRSIAALALLCLAAPAAEAKTRADCDKIENPMLFNLCLASLAPEKARRVSRGRIAPDDEDEEPRGRRGRAKKPVVEGPVKTIGGGRKRIEFPVR